MKYRVRVDMAFSNEAEALALLALAKGHCTKAVNVNESGNKEVSFCELEICHHEEGLPCERLERVEVVSAP